MEKKTRNESKSKPLELLIDSSNYFIGLNCIRRIAFFMKIRSKALFFRVALVHFIYLFHEQQLMLPAMSKSPIELLTNKQAFCPPKLKRTKMRPRFFFFKFIYVLFLLCFALLRFHPCSKTCLFVCLFINDSSSLYIQLHSVHLDVSSDMLENEATLKWMSWSMYTLLIRCKMIVKNSFRHQMRTFLSDFWSRRNNLDDVVSAKIPRYTDKMGKF